MKRLSFFGASAIVALVAFSGSASAHHGDAGRYIEEIVELTGVVIETQLINPHSILVFDVTTDGKTVRWQAELGGAQAFIRMGWAARVKPGMQVTLEGRRLRSGAPYINMTERARLVLTETGEEMLRNSNYGEPAG